MCNGVFGCGGTAGDTISPVFAAIDAVTNHSTIAHPQTDAYPATTFFSFAKNP